MLRDANTGRSVEELPRQAADDLAEVLRRVTPEDIAAMQRQMEEWADETGDERTDFFASNWKTGLDWEQVAGGVFQPLFRACNEDFQRAGWMFGWLVRRMMIRRSETEDWVMYKNPEAGSPELSRSFWGTFYWRENRHEATA
jgi:hypothetical protein